MDSDISTSNNIAIIGAGLVGSLAALQLGKLGYNIDVYEYRNDIRKSEIIVGRSINLALSTRGRKALRDVGLEEVVLQNCIPMKGRMLHNQKGNLKEVIYDPIKNECIYSVGRKYLNEVLLTETEKYKNIHLNFNQKLFDIDLKTGQFHLKNCNTDTENIRSADLVIGCDGAFSAVRKQMEKFPGFNYSQTYIDHGYLGITLNSNQHYS